MKRRNCVSISGGFIMDDNATVIDLFSGAGGLSEGFFRNNFKIISHVEMDSNSAETLHTRTIYHELKDINNENDYYAYLKGEISKSQLIKDNKIKPLRSSTIINRELSNKTEYSVIRRIKKKMEKSEIKNIEGIIGGPPCQAYSLIGRGRDPNCMNEDPRNYLYYHYLKFLEEFKPSFFVFENVVGIKSAQNGLIYSDLQEKVNRMGYEFHAEILNAEDFQVLQSRRRLIIIGFKLEERTDEKSFDSLFQKKESKYKVNDVFEDLPPLEPGSGTDEVQEYKGPPSEYIDKMGFRSKKDVLLNHNARCHNKRDREIYKLTIRAWNDHKKRLKYFELPKYLQSHKNTKSFKDRYKVVAGDLPTSHTIVAHISKDGHYHIHPDINQARSLTVREAARIQSFPDNFKFEGSRSSQYIQVGNAVPPLMAEKIAEKIKETLE